MLFAKLCLEEEEEAGKPRSEFCILCCTQPSGIGSSSLIDVCIFIDWGVAVILVMDVG